MARLERKKPSEIRGSREYGRRLQWKPGYGPLEARIPQKPEPEKNIVPNASSLSPAQVADKMKAEKKKKGDGEAFANFCRGISEIVIMQLVNALDVTDSFIRIDAASLLETAARDGVDISVALDALHRNIHTVSRPSQLSAQALTYHYINKKDWSPISTLLKHPNIMIVKSSLCVLASAASRGIDIRPMLNILTGMIGKARIYSELSNTFRFAVKNETSRHDAIYFLVKSLADLDHRVFERAGQIITDSVGEDKKIAREINYTLKQWLRGRGLSQQTDYVVWKIKRYCFDVIDNC